MLDHVVATAPGRLAPGVETLVPGRLHVLRNACVLDGRMSSYPSDARGYTAVNCFLLTEPGAAVLLDTGFSVHAPQIVAQLRSVLAPGTRLSVYPLRINEFMSVCNVETIADHFDVEQCYSGNPDASLWVDFGGRSDSAGGAAPPLKTTLVARVQTLQLGTGGDRPIDAFQAPIRLIGTRWLYDRATRTLFTSDSFTHEWSASADGPWTVDRPEDAAPEAHLRSFLLNTRYWWLEGGQTAALRTKLRDVFDQHEIETIAPGYGRIFRGRGVVQRQFAMMDAVLADLGDNAARYIARDDLR